MASKTFKIKDIFKDYWDAFVAQGYPIRSAVLKNIDKIIRCGAKYIQDRANSISSKLINCKHRHIAFTIPEELRIFFRKDRKLLHLLFYPHLVL